MSVRIAARSSTTEGAIERGLRVATALAQSAVNSFVCKRMVKKQQMRWLLCGAHMIMQVRTAELNGELRDRLRALFRPPEAGLPSIFKPRIKCHATGRHGERCRGEPAGHGQEAGIIRPGRQLTGPAPGSAYRGGSLMRLRPPVSPVPHQACLRPAPLFGA